METESAPMLRLGDLAISPETVWVGNTMFPTRNIAGVQTGPVAVSAERTWLVGLYIIVAVFVALPGCGLLMALANDNRPTRGSADNLLAVCTIIFAAALAFIVLAVREARRKRTDYALIITANSGQQAQANFTNQAALDKATNALAYVFNQAGQHVNMNVLVLNEADAERSRPVISRTIR